ncbi:DUF1853 family protein [Marinomonas algarum]|uniref:DUF1853 family protein n=1 Tax=Marinomonas algarum TaxID=2883105 RepID=A0A9X1IPG9_9GAMM|nr:DUF1853 family protein [Marinomonas algarum]MCB5162752.1 DUF1853 family protein [Marinomonas algarum]
MTMTMATGQDSVVDDLIWLVEGHYIECDFDLTPYWHENIAERLQTLSDHPAPLYTALAECKSHFMGSYFETLFSFAIEHLSTLIIRLEHTQIQADGRTLGEVDMLVETPIGTFHQFEIAIKFYLERPDLAPHDWIGPNKNDSLLKKVTRARQHQLTMFTTPPGAAILDAVANKQKADGNLLMFGRLYSALNSQADIDAWLQQADRGGWIRVELLPRLAQHFTHYAKMKKPHWMASPSREAVSLLCAERLAAECVHAFLSDDRPVHLCLWPTTGLNRVNPSPKALFVVPEGW